MTKQEAAEIVGLSAKTIERYVTRGVIPAFKPAGKVRIRRVDLTAWIESTRVAHSVHDI